jgi:hypothetical protein
MLQADGIIGVQWEGPRGDHLRRYALDGQSDGGRCPHCAILAGVQVLASVLPLDGLRAARTRDQYMTVVRMGKLPCAAFASRPGTGTGPLTQITRGLPTAGWVADCHMGEGNPHSTRDCAEHRAM